MFSLSGVYVYLGVVGWGFRFMKEGNARDGKERERKGGEGGGGKDRGREGRKE